MPEVRIEDTIAAIATPFGEGGICVIRISGPSAFDVVEEVFQPLKGKLKEFASHTIHRGQIQTREKKILDQALVSIFCAPHSYTGEDVIEISSHGGMVISRSILDLLIAGGARHAEPGEFTKRAFLNGKIDLTQAEAVLDLIKARSQKSLETAARQLSGSLSHTLKQLKEDMMQIYAHLEAYIDFPDEYLEVYENKDFLKRFEEIQNRITQLLSGFKRGAFLREGVSTVIVGKPNVGKSSLFNALLSRDRALVSEYPGTTRDPLEEAIEVGGFYIRLVDTAGLATETTDPLEHMGMERARKAVQEGQLFLFLLDSSRPLSEADRQIMKDIKAVLSQRELFEEDMPIIILSNKSDLDSQISKEDLKDLAGGIKVLRISTKTREGLDQLEAQLADRLEKGLKGLGGEGQQVTRLRHKRALEDALASLVRTKQAFLNRESLELVSVDLKASLDALRELVGEIYSEDLLDVIFAEFCIGK